MIIGLIFLLAVVSCSQVLNYETIIFADQNKKITERRFSILIPDKESNWLSHVEIRHRPYQDFKFLKAEIIDSQGNTVRKLRKKDVETRSNISHESFYQDDLIEEFDLFWHSYPYRIEYSYEMSEEEFIYVANWFPAVYKNIPTLKSSLLIRIPESYAVNMHYSEEIEFDEQKDKNERILKWDYTDNPALIDERYAPPFYENAPRVMVIPENFHYGVPGRSESWATFGDWVSRLNEGMDQLPYSEKKKVDRIIQGINDRKEIVKTLYQYMQSETKYVNVSIDVGGLRSYPAEYVCKNKYGDCKALTTYMQALLKYAGIKSYYTLVNSGAETQKINTLVPGQQFNHVILTMPFEKDTVWLENTSNTLPFNYLGTFTQDRYALFIDGENSRLIKTPSLSAGDVIERRDFIFRSVNNDNEWNFEYLKRAGGEDFEKYAYYSTHLSKEEKKNKLVNELRLEHPKVSEWSLEEYPGEINALNVRLMGRCEPSIREIGGFTVLNSLRLEIPDFEDPSERSNAVRINFPINKVDSSVYIIPMWHNKEIQLPESIEISEKYGYYRAHQQLIDDKIIVTESFLLNKGDYTLNEYNQLFSFLDKINSYKKTSSIIIK
mgnify:FL=1